MPNPRPAKEWDIFRTARKAGKKSAAEESCSKDDNMTIAEVLAELKALRSKFGSKLNRIDGCLNVQFYLSIREQFFGHQARRLLQQKRIDEAETRISATEDTLSRMEASLAVAMKRIAQLKYKIWRTMEGVKTSGYLVLRKAQRALTCFWTL